MNEYETMTKQIEKVSKEVDKILNNCNEEEKPKAEYGWSGTSIDLWITGGNYQIRKLVENHMINSSKYRSVTMQNYDTKKHFNFYLK